MSHQSETIHRLSLKTKPISTVCELQQVEALNLPNVYFLWLPPGRSDFVAAASSPIYEDITKFCESLDSRSTVCILTTPPDAARLLPTLEKTLKFQLWIPIKLSKKSQFVQDEKLTEQHTALLIFTRYHQSLKHTKTRIQYTYCPSCGKTTKDYGGKKHVYHEYGTLLSDVWRDIDCDPRENIDLILDRLRDLFGQEPYQSINLIDLRFCAELRPDNAKSTFKETQLALSWQDTSLPLDSRLINKDCFDALREIPDNSIDFCFADPPYNIEKKYDHWNDALELKDYFQWCDKWLSELARVLKPGRTLAVVNIPLWAVRHFQYLQGELTFQTWIAWEALSLPVRMIMPAHYAILCFTKGKPRSLPNLNSKTESEDLTTLTEGFCLRSSCIANRNRNGVVDREIVGSLWHDIHRLKHNSRRVDHPCQLPPQLMKRLYALFTKPGEIVLDCFNGAGTSTLVAHQMHRRFIGIEVSAYYHGIAQQRHSEIEKGFDPFGKRNTMPKVKNSRVNRLPKIKYVVSKKNLQLEVRRIAHQLGHLPTREEVIQQSKFPIKYYDEYFSSWGEVCAAARTTGMTELPIEIVGNDLQLSLL